MLQESPGVRETLLRFYDRLSAGDVSQFDALVSSDPATRVIGTAPGEIVTERPRLRFGFEAEGLRLEGGDMTAYEGGTVGWAFDYPRFVFPDGSGMLARLTAILHREDDRWKIVHMHYSVGVPDEEVGELQARWLAASGGKP